MPIDRQIYRNTWTAELVELPFPSGELAISMPPVSSRIEVHQFRVFATRDGAEIPTPELRVMLWDVSVRVVLGDVIAQTWEPLIVLLEPWPQPAQMAIGYSARVELRVPKPLQIDRLLFAIDYRNLWQAREK